MKNILKGLLLVGLLTAGLASTLASPVNTLLNYDPNLPAPAPILGAGWTSDEVVGAGIASLDSTYDYNLAFEAKLTVTDAFLATDVFKVYDNGILILTTSNPGLDPSAFESTGEDAYANPAYSKGSVILAAGLHSLTVISEIETGVAPAGFFTRLDAVSTPDAGSLGLASGLAWMGLIGLGNYWRKRS